MEGAADKVETEADKLARAEDEISTRRYLPCRHVSDHDGTFSHVWCGSRVH